MNPLQHAIRAVPSDRRGDYVQWRLIGPVPLPPHVRTLMQRDAAERVRAVRTRIRNVRRPAVVMGMMVVF